MRICKNGPLDKFMRFLFMPSSALCIVTYGVIKIYVEQIYYPFPIILQTRTSQNGNGHCASFRLFPDL